MTKKIFFIFAFYRILDINYHSLKKTREYMTGTSLIKKEHSPYRKLVENEISLLSKMLLRGIDQWIHIDTFCNYETTKVDLKRVNIYIWYHMICIDAWRCGLIHLQMRDLQGYLSDCEFAFFRCKVNTTE